MRQKKQNYIKAAKAITVNAMRVKIIAVADTVHNT